MPDWREQIRKRLAGAKLGAARENEIVEELTQHLDDAYEQALRDGATEIEAYRSTIRQLTEGNLLGEELRRVHHPVRQEQIVEGGPSKGSILKDIGQDMRFGLRVLFKNPGFTLVAVI